MLKKMWNRRNARKVMIASFAAVAVMVLSIALADHAVRDSAAGRTFDDARALPPASVGLLLGTGKHVAGGRINLYYKYRLEAAMELYQQGAIEQLIISGDNSRSDYDEPTTMKDDLVAMGFPAERIHLDYAGFSTLDSVIRCKAIFGQTKVVVISQAFHNQRAIYLAEHHGMEAVGFNAQAVTAGYGWKVALRERLARVKVVMDVALNTQPRFLGEKIHIR